MSGVTNKHQQLSAGSPGGMISYNSTILHFCASVEMKRFFSLGADGPLEYPTTKSSRPIDGSLSLSLFAGIYFSPPTLSLNPYILQKKDRTVQ